MSNTGSFAIISSMRRWFIALAATLTAIAAAAYPQSLADYEKNITEHALSNGMRFIILRDHTAPVVTFHVQVNTGSVDEKYGETGISHIIEHLAFNGTARVGTTNWKEEKKLFDEMDGIHEKILKLRKNIRRNDAIILTPALSAQGKGEKPASEQLLLNLEGEFGRLKKKAAGYGQPNEFGKLLDMHGAVGPNAYTSNDLTVYWVELPSNKTELWAFLESDRLFRPVFRSFYEELDVIREERRMHVDNSPWGKLMEEFHGAAYKVHPYRNPIIGYPEDLEEVTRRKVKDFYSKHYVPSNIIAVIVGDVNPDELLPVMEKYFGRTPAGIHASSFIPSEPPQGKTERRALVKMSSEPIFMAGFQIPDANHPDIPALKVCAEILSGGRTSRLYREMVIKKRSALSTGAWCRSQKYPGLFYVWAIAARGATNDAIETAIFEELEQMRTGLIADGEIDGAKARLNMEFLTGLASRRGLAAELAAYQSITGDWRNLFSYTDKIEKVSAQDIKTVMEKYLLPANRIVGTVEREQEK